MIWNERINRFLSENEVQKIIEKAKKKLEESTDIFEFGRTLNKYWSYQDKVDFICCAFEVGYSDGDLHYLEHHTIKKIANIFNLHRDDIVLAKAEIESYLKSPSIFTDLKFFAQLLYKSISCLLHTESRSALRFLRFFFSIFLSFS